MSMSLLEEIPLEDLKDEPERFDFLDMVTDKIIKIVEMHPDDDNDSVYIYMLWTHPDVSKDVWQQICHNCTLPSIGYGWRYDVQHLDEGMIMIFAEIE